MKNIPYKSVLQHITNIEKRNKAFHSLSNRIKRKEIAYDALSLVLNKTVSGADGCYWDGYLTMTLANIEDPKLFQKKVLNPPICQVCARGGLMLSQIRLGNNISHKPENYTIRDIASGSGGVKIEGFNDRSFEKIENEYEFSYYGHPYNVGTTFKLINILCNIIVNENFDVKDDSDYIKIFNLDDLL